MATLVRIKKIFFWIEICLNISFSLAFAVSQWKCYIISYIAFAIAFANCKNALRFIVLRFINADSEYK